MAKDTEINRKWHEQHRMPKHATIEQRIAWHLEHQKKLSLQANTCKAAEEIDKRKVK